METLKEIFFLNSLNAKLFFLNALQETLQIQTSKNYFTKNLHGKFLKKISRKFLIII